MSVRLASPVLWLLIAQGAVVAVGLVLAAPGIRRPEVRDPVRTARRAAFVGRSRTVSPRERRSSTLRRILTVAIAVVAVALVVVGGTVLRPQAAPLRTSQAPLVGRTTTVCTTSPAEDATATVSAVAIRKAPGREGTLTGTAVGSSTPLMTVDRQGFGDQQPAPAQPVVLAGEGVMATAGSGMVTSRASRGSSPG